MNDSSDRRSFFQHGAWMMSATFLAGVFMMLTQAVGVWVFDTKGDKSLMIGLYKVLNLFMIPGVGLQILFARQASAAFGNPTLSETVARFARGAFLIVILAWLLLGVVVALFEQTIVAYFETQTAAPIWMTWLGVGFLSVLPIPIGWLQGVQRFRELGAALLSNGIARFALALVLCAWLHWRVFGAVTAATLGFAVGLLIALAATPELRRARGITFETGIWVRHFAPLSLALGIPQFLLSFDMIVIRGADFPKSEMDMYSVANLFGAGLVMFTAPLAQVMFPRIVRHKETGSPTRALRDTLVAVAVLACAVSASLTVFSAILPFALERLAESSQVPSWIPREKSLAAAPDLLLFAELLPRFLWALTPLCLANVLMNHIAARGLYKTLPASLSIALAYGVYISFHHNSFHEVLTALLTTNCLLVTLLTVVAVRERQAEVRKTLQN